MEDLKVAYDQSIRNHLGEIISFVYGDDGFDPSALEAQVTLFSLLRSFVFVRALSSRGRV